MLWKGCQISISLHPKNFIFFELCNAHVVSLHLQFFKLSQFHRQRAAHMFLSHLYKNTYIFQIYIYILHWVSMFISVHSFKVKLYVIYHNISSNHWGKSYLTAEKQQRGQAITQFKPTKQGQIYTLQTSTYLILQTNPLPLQSSNGENMKFIWVTKLKMIENQKGLALQRWMQVIIFSIFHIKFKNTSLQS